MIGNDVVDLEDPDTRPESFRPRFDERVFDPVERRAIAKDADPHLRRWAHWAAKEAAYKLARQVDDGFVFSPGRMVVRFEGALSESGRHTVRRGSIELPRSIAPGLGLLDVRSDETSERVHVVATAPGADPEAVVSSIEEISAGDDASERVRLLARQTIARDLGIDDARVSIGRRGNPRDGGAAKIPTALIDGSRSGLVLSLSHHGRFVACAMTLRADPESREPRSGGPGAIGGSSESGYGASGRVPGAAMHPGLAFVADPGRNEVVG